MVQQFVKIYITEYISLASTNASGHSGDTRGIYKNLCYRKETYL